MQSANHQHTNLGDTEKQSGNNKLHSLCNFDLYPKRVYHGACRNVCFTTVSDCGFDLHPNCIYFSAYGNARFTAVSTCAVIQSADEKLIMLD